MAAPVIVAARSELADVMARITPDDIERQVALIAEGHCPTCGGRLGYLSLPPDRQSTRPGWCRACRRGWECDGTPDDAYCNEYRWDATWKGGAGWRPS